MRQIAHDQYRLSAALNFMIHMTIKGFFKPVSNIIRQNLIGDLDRYVSGCDPLKIYPGDLGIFERDRSLEILKDAKDDLSDVKLNGGGPAQLPPSKN